METVSAEIIREKLNQKAKGPYWELIEQLPIGAALKINPARDWTTRRESVYHYFLTRFKKRVTVTKCEGYYYVIKIA